MKESVKQNFDILNGKEEVVKYIEENRKRYMIYIVEIL